MSTENQCDKVVKKKKKHQLIKVCFLEPILTLTMSFFHGFWLKRPAGEDLHHSWTDCVWSEGCQSAAGDSHSWSAYRSLHLENACDSLSYTPLEQSCSVRNRAVPFWLLASLWWSRLVFGQIWDAPWLSCFCWYCQVLH